MDRVGPGPGGGREGWRRFLVAWVAGSVLAGAVALPLRFAPAALACAGPPPAGSFLAYCEGPFGDVEHAAYFRRLEPEAVAGGRSASVLMLGNSKLQLALSGESTRSFFQDAGIGYHLLGFGYADGAGFAQPLLARLSPKPKVLVVNVDPFFTPQLSEPATEAISGGPTRRIRLWQKWAAARLQALLCGAVDICGQAPTIFRESTNGRWTIVSKTNVFERRGPDGRPLVFPVDEAGALPPLDIDGMAQLGAAMLAPLALDPGCIILTTVPEAAWRWEPLVEALAARWGAQVLLPRVEGLVTLDRHHMDAASVERWSAAILLALRPVLDRCVPTAARRSSP